MLLRLILPWRRFKPSLITCASRKVAQLRPLGGSAAALIVIVLILSEVIGLTFYPQPGTVSGWFMLF